VKPGAQFTASIGWQPPAASLSESTTDLTNSEDDEVIGATLQTDARTLASDAEIPSHRCTLQFHFTDTPNDTVIYALNNVSWTCTSAPVSAWCKLTSF